MSSIAVFSLLLVLFFVLAVLFRSDAPLASWFYILVVCFFAYMLGQATRSELATHIPRTHSLQFELSKQPLLPPRIQRCAARFV